MGNFAFFDRFSYLIPHLIWWCLYDKVSILDKLMIICFPPCTSNFITMMKVAKPVHEMLFPW